MRRLARLGLAVLTLATALAASPASAGIHYQSTTTTDSAQPQGDQTIRAEGWVDGDKAKVLFVESSSPLLAEGSYLVTTDGGQNMVLVNPADKTWARFDLDELMSMAGAMMKGMGGMMKMSFQNPRVDKVQASAGEAMLGMPTQRYRYTTSYDLEVKVMGMAQTSHNETTTELWTTTALGDAGLGAWLRREPPKTGNDELDAMIATQVVQGIKGVPLKLVATTRSKDAKGKESLTTTTMVVTSLEQQAVPAGSFEVPAGYEETELMPGLPTGRR